jgi:subtilisin family serine protease
MDLSGHGTHIAGTIGAVGDNGIGATGVCWKVKLMAVRVLDAAGNGNTQSIIDGISYAVSHGAKIINLSLGGDGGFDPLFSSAIDNAKNNDVLVVAAAGNDDSNVDAGDNAIYPCNFSQDNVICVAALDQSYARASFSNYGGTSVDVGAPGTNIRSTWNGTSASQPADDFSSLWYISNTFGDPFGWHVSSVNINGSHYPALLDPGNLNGSNQYSGNSNDQAWKNFFFNNPDAATLSFYIYLDTEPNHDFFNIYQCPGGGSPFATGYQLASLSGSTLGYFVPLGIDISKNLNNTTSIGFNLASDSINNGTGIAILNLIITSVYLNATSYNTADGTSMSAPHVAGIAALIKANRPSYTYSDLAEAIKKGGDFCPALQGITTTGKSVSAWGSMCYIRPPQNVSCSQL